MKLLRLLCLSMLVVLSTVCQAQRCEYVVQRGEDFISIAEKYNVTVDELKAANPSSTVCYIGRKLLIPYRGVPVVHKAPEVEPFDYGLKSSSGKVLTRSATATYQVGQALLKAKKNEEAMAYLAAAADSGEVRSYYPLGLYYSDNKSKNHNPELAAYYYHKSADAVKDKSSEEYWRSCRFLSESFLNGDVLQKNLDEALHYGLEYQRYAIGSEKAHATSLVKEIRSQKHEIAVAEQRRKAEIQRQEQARKVSTSSVQNQSRRSSAPTTQRQTSEGNGRKPYTYTDAFGEHTVYTMEDGTAKFHNKMRCIECLGTGRCKFCMNTMMVNSVVSVPIVCPRCFGSTVCGQCKGKGYTESWNVVDRNGTGYGINDNGNFSTVVNGRSMPSVSGTSSSSRRSRSSSSSTKKENKPIRVIKYGPDYLGGDQSYWCDECKKYGYNHYHQDIK